MGVRVVPGLDKALNCKHRAKMAEVGLVGLLVRPSFVVRGSISTASKGARLRIDSSAGTDETG